MFGLVQSRTVATEQVGEGAAEFGQCALLLLTLLGRRPAGRLLLEYRFDAGQVQQAAVIHLKVHLDALGIDVVCGVFVVDLGDAVQQHVRQVLAAHHTAEEHAHSTSAHQRHAERRCQLRLKNGFKPFLPQTKPLNNN